MDFMSMKNAMTSAGIEPTQSVVIPLTQDISAEYRIISFLSHSDEH
jgi:hypothetical protein